MEMYGNLGSEGKEVKQTSERICEERFKEVYIALLTANRLKRATWNFIKTT
jgi:NifB/MoaA-like Fe-S oxidoreductase